MSIGLPQGERQKLERTLHSTDDLPLAFFKPAQVSVKAEICVLLLSSLNDRYLLPWIFEFSSILSRLLRYEPRTSKNKPGLFLTFAPEFCLQKYTSCKEEFTSDIALPGKFRKKARCNLGFL